MVRQIINLVAFQISTVNDTLPSLEKHVNRLGN
jgi:hypothetical protein